MKRQDLKKIALLGIMSGVVLSQSVQAQDTHQSSAASNTKPSTIKTNEPDPNDGNLGYHLMTEDELLLELNAEGQKMYQSMDAKNKELTLKVASARCANTSECKGLNACKTEKNACAGQGSCKGLGKCAIADKNLAVKLVYDKMQKKRAGANGN